MVCGENPRLSPYRSQSLWQASVAGCNVSFCGLTTHTHCTGASQSSLRPRLIGLRSPSSTSRRLVYSDALHVALGAAHPASYPAAADGGGRARLLVRLARRGRADVTASRSTSPRSAQPWQKHPAPSLRVHPGLALLALNLTLHGRVLTAGRRAASASGAAPSPVAEVRAEASAGPSEADLEEYVGVWRAAGIEGRDELLTAMALPWILRQVGKDR